jgi:hypothetical protein
MFIENIQESMDKHVLGLFFDLTKAYVINNEILLAILEYYAIRGTIKARIESFLTHRSQFVEMVKTDKENTNMYIILHIRK